MGDPKKLRKKYATPMHPWNVNQIEVEKELLNSYGLGNKKEIWKMVSILKKYKAIAKRLIADQTEQGAKEKEQMMNKLQKLGLINAGAELDDVLSLETKDIMERRLQSLVFRKGMARSMKQARQFIVHRLIMVGDKKITFPSYVVSQEEEAQIKFDANKSLADEEHPERVNINKDIQAEAAAIKKKPKKEDSGEESPEIEIKPANGEEDEATPVKEETQVKEVKKEAPVKEEKPEEVKE